MSIDAMKAAFELQGVSATDTLVLIALGNFADEENRCFPSKATLVSMTKLKPRALTGILRRLETGGYITREVRLRDNGSHTSNRYILHVDGWGDLSAPSPPDAPPDPAPEAPKGASQAPPEPSPNPQIEPRATDVALAPASRPPSPERQAFDLWNRIAEEQGWKIAKLFNDVRRRHIAARLRECDGLSGWSDALQRCVLSPFLSGRTRGAFKIDLDFVLRPSSFTKLLEGFYDHRRPEPASGDPSGRAASHDRRTDAMLAGAASAFGAGSRGS